MDHQWEAEQCNELAQLVECAWFNSSAAQYQIKPRLIHDCFKASMLTSIPHATDFTREKIYRENFCRMGALVVG
jgi:hypothetical protein